MRSVKKFLDYGETNQYQRMQREALIYQLINMYDTGYVDSDGVSSGKMTIGAKRRLRNQILSEARSIEKAAQANGEDLTVNNVDVIVNAFLTTANKVSSLQDKVDTIAADWATETSTVRTEVLSDIQSWFDSGVAVVSPCDPYFAKSDAFSDENDGFGYISFGNVTDDAEFSSVIVDRVNTIKSFSNWSDIQTIAPSELDGPVVRSGFSDISHYIKSADYNDVYKFLMNQKVREVEPSEIEFMRSVCEMMAEHGYDFTINVEKPDKLRLKMAGGTEIRLLDLAENQYNGRIYDNGIHAHLSLTKGSNVDVGSILTNDDRLAMIKWYFGIQDGKPVFVQETGSKMVAKTHRVGVQHTYANAMTQSAGSGRTLNSINSVSVYNSRSRSGPGNSVLLRALNFGNAAENNAVKIMISETTSPRYNPPEVQFASSIKSLDDDKIRNNTYAWNEFKQSIPLEFIPLSDREFVQDEDGTEHVQVKEFVDSVNFEYYKTLPAYLVLNDWVESAKVRHRELMQFDTLVLDADKYEIDSSYYPDSSGDDAVDELRTIYWKILTGKIKLDELSGFASVEDSEMLTNGTREEKLAFIQAHYDAYLHREFGELPKLQIPGEPIVDNTDTGFNPEKVAKYTAANGNVGTQKNYDYIRHMLSRLGDAYSPDWIKGNSYIGNQIKNDLIRYNPDAVLGSFKFNSIVNAYDNTDPQAVQKIMSRFPELANKPVTVEMMIHVGETLLASGVSKDSIELSVDENGIIKYSGMQSTTVYTSNNADSQRELSGYIGQIFEPDEYGVIDPKYVVDTGLVFVPGYNVYMVPNDPENPTELHDRIRGVGWKKQMRQQITKELRRAAFQVASEYSFTPRTASLNTVYSHVYDTSISREDYQEHIDAHKSNPTPETETFIHILTDLAGRCRFSNSIGDGASTMTQSMLEHPDRDESKSYDFFYSDLYGNKNIRVLDASFDGLFDPNATGTAKTQGVVRYLAIGAGFDDVTGKPVMVEFGPDEPVPQCALMQDQLMRNKNHNTWDRRLMAFSQILTAWHTPRDVGVAMMNIKGLTFDDGFVVSKRFAEKYSVKDTNGNPRPLVAQDKLSDMNGNKGVISLVVDPDLMSETIAQTLSDEYDFEGVPDGNGVLDVVFRDVTYHVPFDTASDDSLALQAAYFIQHELGVYGFDDVMRVFRDNENLDVVMAPYSGMSRFNGGSMVTLMEESDKSKDLVLNGETIEGGIGYTDLIVVDMLADVKTHFYTEDAVKEGKGRKASGQLAWALQSKGANMIMKEFYGDNSKAFDDLREYALAVGLDFNEKFEPLIGYHPQTSRGEKRRMIVLPEVSSFDMEYRKPKKAGQRGYFVFGSASSNAIVDDIMRQLNATGGFMELPFQLDFKTAEGVSGVIGKNQIPEDAFLLQKTGHTYTTFDEHGNAVTHETFGLPVLSQSLRSGQEFQDGTSKVHDYTMAYVSIYRNALLYKALQQEAAVLKPQLDEMTATANALVAKYASSVSSYDDLITKALGKKATLTNLDFSYSVTNKKGETITYEGIEALKKFRLDYSTMQLRYADASNSATLEQLVAESQAKLDEVVSDIREHKFDSKYNVIREEVMSKRLSNSATAVWSADPRLKSDEVSMSFENAVTIGLTNAFKYDDIVNSNNKKFNMSFDNTYREVVDENGVKSYERITALHQLKEGDVVHQLSSDASILIWRDPVLHDGNVRYMNVVIDNRLKGCAINPLMDASFDGDFDGDSVALVVLQTDEARKQAYTAFSFETNLLNLGVKQEIENPSNPGETIIGHPLYIQKGLDTAALMYENEELKAQRGQLEYDINVFESMVKQLNAGEISEADFTSKYKSYRVDRETGERVLKDSKYIINDIRKSFKNRIDKWMQASLDGIGQDIIRVDTPEHLVESLQHIVDDKAKGSQSKMLDLAKNIGLVFECDEDGRAIASTARRVVDANGNYVSLDTLNNCQRSTDNAIQETAAYKADNTQLGGMAAQRGVSAFRDIDIHAALEITYPVTQAILQSKHDPKDAKIKDEIVRFWGSDCWDGYKLSGDWGDDVSVEDLQNQPHVRETRPVLNPETGEPIPVQVYNETTEKWEDKRDKDGNVVYEREYVKCTRDEWVQQMKGMMRALKVDDSINSDYIECLADAMVQGEGSYGQAVSASSGRVITYMTSQKQRAVVRTGSNDTVLGVSDYIKQRGTLLDQMGYIGKFGACLNKAMMTSSDYVANMRAKGQDYLLESRLAQDSTAMSVIGNAVGEAISIKSAEDSIAEARAAVVAASKDEKAEKKAELKAVETGYKSAMSDLSNSSMFVAQNVMTELYGDAQRREKIGAFVAEHKIDISSAKTLDDVTSIVSAHADTQGMVGEAKVEFMKSWNDQIVNSNKVYKNKVCVTVQSAPKPMGRKDCLLTPVAYEDGVAFMCESQASYEARLKVAEKHMAEKARINEEALTALRTQQAESISDSIEEPTSVDPGDFGNS